ncbi:MAG: hypothetical protein Fur0018_12960 [Anaerolineales bacterium]
MGDKILVLIVDDIAETRENIRKLLQFEGDVEVVGAARNGKEAIQLAKETHPDVVLMDINMPDMDGITATEKIKQILPYSQIIILSVQNDPNYMRRAMMAGARDFLSKPPTVDELTAAVRRAGKMAQAEKDKVGAVASVTTGASGGVMSGGFSRQGKIITVYSPKGGTGCTTLATNLAVTLHNPDTPTVLLDANFQFGDVSVFLNEQPRNTILDLAPRVDELDNEIFEEVLITHNASGIKVLAAPIRPEYAENISAAQFAKILQYLRRMFSYIIIDTPSTLTDAVISALDEMDLVILITTQDIPAIKNARVFLDLLDMMKIERNRVLLTINLFDRRIASITPERIGENFRLPVGGVIPLDRSVVVPAVNRGIPFMLKDKSNPLAQRILALAGEVRRKLSELEKAQSEV